MILDGKKLNDAELEDVNGGAPKKGKAKCPKCGQYTFVIRYKKFTCTACGYTRQMG